MMHTFIHILIVIALALAGCWIFYLEDRVNNLEDKLDKLTKDKE